MKGKNFFCAEEIWEKILSDLAFPSNISLESWSLRLPGELLLPPLILSFEELAFHSTPLTATTHQGDRRRRSATTTTTTEKKKKTQIPAPSFPSMAVVAESQFHVLAVDDSLLDRKLIERLLKTSSFQVTTVDSGSKALEFLGLQDELAKPSTPSSSPEMVVNLIITDYCMPGMTGFELLKKVKGSSSLRDIPVVIMSSENEPSRISMCLEEGAEEFLLKPVRLADVKKLRLHAMKASFKCLQRQLKQPAMDGECSSCGGGGGGSKKRKAAAEALESLPERRRPRLANGPPIALCDQKIQSTCL